VSNYVLIVDDDDAIRDLVSDVLDAEGYSVATARNGADALQFIEQERPALVLLDMRMPILDGWGFAHAVKQRGWAVPIIVMTAASDAQQWANEIGAESYLAKPFDLNDLLSSVARVA
jgi:CheY-like chemotaxis protein